jgi:hypothetical protein
MPLQTIRDRQGMEQQRATPLRHRIRKRLAWYRKAQFYWNGFARELAKIKTFEEAVEFVERGPTKNHPHCRYYANLNVLLQARCIPEDSTWEEIELYLHLVENWKKNSSHLFMPEELERLQRCLSLCKSGVQ